MWRYAQTVCDEAVHDSDSDSDGDGDDGGELELERLGK